MTQHWIIFLKITIYIIIPLLGLFAHWRIRPLPFFIFLVILWTVVGLFIFGGGITPLGPEDIVTKEDKKYWFDQPWVITFLPVYWYGVLYGIMGLVVTILFEKVMILKKKYKWLASLLLILSFLWGVLGFFGIYKL